MTISFDSVSPDIRVPLFYAEIDNSAANIPQGNAGPSLLIGTPADKIDVPVQPILVSSAEQIAKIAGPGSQLARMAKAYRTIDQVGELWVIPANIPDGAAAEGKISLSGTASANGSFSVYIGSDVYYVVVRADDTAVELAKAVANVINNDSDTRFVATVDPSKSEVILTCKSVGAAGNGIPVALNYRGNAASETLPEGLSVTIIQPTGGAGIPAIAKIISAMGDETYDFIGLPFTDPSSLNAMRDEMSEASGRWSYARQLYGHVYGAARGSTAALVTLVGERNDQHLSIAGYEEDVQTALDELIALRVARNAVFIRVDPARPVQTGLLNGSLPARSGKRFLLGERNILLKYGVASAYTQSGQLRIEREVTTYTRNAYNQPDVSYLDSETLHTCAYVLRRLKSVITSKYGRHKLANDGTRFGAGQAIITPKVARGEICAEYKRLEMSGIVENFDLFNKHLIVERSKTNPNRLDVLFPPDFVNQLRIFAVAMQFRLQYETEEE